MTEPVIFLDGRVTRPSMRKQDCVTIYALCHPLSGKVRYIGKSQYLPTRRLIYHIRDARAGGARPVAHWLRGIDKKNLRPIISVLERVPLGDDWAAREKYWIAEHRSAGASLLNLTDGGEGLSGHRFAGTRHAKRIGDALRRGAYFQCERCAASFWRKPRDIKKGHARYCSRMCSNRRAHDV